MKLKNKIFYIKINEKGNRNAWVVVSGRVHTSMQIVNKRDRNAKREKRENQKENLCTSVLCASQYLRAPMSTVAAGSRQMPVKETGQSLLLHMKMLRKQQTKC